MPRVGNLNRRRTDAAFKHGFYVDCEGGTRNVVRECRDTAQHNGICGAQGPRQGRCRSRPAKDRRERSKSRQSKHALPSRLRSLILPSHLLSLAKRCGYPWNHLQVVPVMIREPRHTAPKDARPIVPEGRCADPVLLIFGKGRRGPDVPQGSGSGSIAPESAAGAHAPIASPQVVPEFQTDAGQLYETRLLAMYVPSCCRRRMVGKATAQLQLAELYQTSNQPLDAKRLYEQIKKDNPGPGSGADGDPETGGAEVERGSASRL